MTRPLGADEVLQNEEAAGRYPAGTGHGRGGRRALRTAVVRLLDERPCPVCKGNKRDTRAYSNPERTEWTAYAICKECGHHERL